MTEKQEFIEKILQGHRTSLSGDFEKYRNHVYRVYGLTLHFAGKGASAEDLQKIAVASAFHDLGIWTHATFDYLGPSETLANEFLESTDREAWKPEVLSMIEWHHKLSTFKGPNERFTEAFRKADLTDLSFGMISFGLEKGVYRSMVRKYPYCGFHRFLVRKVAMNLIKNPADPLPMFRR